MSEWLNIGDAKQTAIKLNNGCVIPQFGLGVFMIAGDAATERACSEALKLGYRHIDTAHAYQNERGVGAAVKKSGIPRSEVWITSKLWPSEYAEGAAMAGIDHMLQRLQTDHLDLLLLHQQFGDYLGAWKDMERAVRAGKVRAIGLSNFESDRLETLCLAATVKPAVLQVECHPYYQQQALKARIAPYKMAIESWYPLGHADAALLHEPVLTDLAKRYGKSTAQIILRWHIQAGNIVFPKSANVQHLKDNIDIFDFCLSDADMASIQALDCGKRFFTMTLAEQEQNLSGFTPAD